MRLLRIIGVAALIVMMLLVTGFQQPLRFVRIGTASMGGAFFPMGNALAQLLTEKMPGVRSSSQSTGGSAANARMLARKELELALIQSATLTEASRGEGQFKDGAIGDIRAITAIYFMPFHVIVRQDANVNTVSDLKGKRIGVGPIGSGIEVNSLLLLRAYGIGPRDFQAIHQSQQETFEGLKTGAVQAHIYATGAGSAQITDIMLSGRHKIVPIDQDKIAQITQTNPEFGKFIIKRNTYPNQNYDIPTMAGSAVLVARADIDDENIYRITKIIFENLPFLVERHAYFAETTLEDATVGIVVPLHPGAARYLREVGAIK